MVPNVSLGYRHLLLLPRGGKAGRLWDFGVRGVGVPQVGRPAGVPVPVAPGRPVGGSRRLTRQDSIEGLCTIPSGWEIRSGRLGQGRGFPGGTLSFQGHVLLREGLYVCCVFCGDKREFVQRKAMVACAYKHTASKGSVTKGCARVKGHCWVRSGQGHECLMCGILSLNMAGVRRLARCNGATGESLRNFVTTIFPTGSEARLSVVP